MVSVPFADNFFLCGQEGLYQLEKGHEHKTQEDADTCTLRWGVRMAIHRDKLLRAVESGMKFIRSKAPKNYAQMKTYQELEAALGLKKPEGAKAASAGNSQAASADKEST